MSKNNNNNNKKKSKLLNDKYKEIIKDAFILFDMNSDGHLDYYELKAALRAMGFMVKKVEILKILSTYDKVNKNLIAYDDFYYIVTDKIQKRDPVEEVRNAFKLFTLSDPTGITCRDLNRIAQTIGADLDTEEIQGMIEEFDQDNDGKSLGFY